MKPAEGTGRFVLVSGMNSERWVHNQVVRREDPALPYMSYLREFSSKGSLDGHSDVQEIQLAYELRHEFRAPGMATIFERLTAYKSQLVDGLELTIAAAGPDGISWDTVKVLHSGLIEIRDLFRFLRRRTKGNGEVAARLYGKKSDVEYEKAQVVHNKLTQALSVAKRVSKRSKQRVVSTFGYSRKRTHNQAFSRQSNRRGGAQNSMRRDGSGRFSSTVPSSSSNKKSGSRSA